MLIQTSSPPLADEPELTAEELADQPPPERGRRARKIALGAGVLLLVESSPL